MIVGTTHLPHIRQTTKRREASLKESVKTFIEHAKRMLKLTHHGLQLLKCKTSLRTKKNRNEKENMRRRQRLIFRAFQKESS